MLVCYRRGCIPANRSGLARQVRCPLRVTDGRHPFFDRMEIERPICAIRSISPRNTVDTVLFSVF